MEKYNNYKSKIDSSSGKQTQYTTTASFFSKVDSTVKKKDVKPEINN